MVTKQTGVVGFHQLSSQMQFLSGYFFPYLVLHLLLEICNVSFYSVFFVCLFVSFFVSLFAISQTVG